ncbi:MAG TPA: hypothetical protein VGK74_19850 [Symbiobacteriaceae bacterium]|jgi:hypothetical protein
MKRFVAVTLGLLLASFIPVASLAKGKAGREAEMMRTMRAVLAQTKDPRQVAGLLSNHGARFIGYQENKVTFVYTGDRVVPAQSVTKSVGPDFLPVVAVKNPAGAVRPDAGDKTDFTLTLWLYEWQNYDNTYTEQAVVNGYWSATEYPWLDQPADVIDVRWIVGDVVYLSSQPYDGVMRDQHTNGIASYTVADQVRNWDLYVNFKPVSSSVYGKWSNVFANYTHTWWGRAQKGSGVPRRSRNPRSFLCCLQGSA